MTSHTKVREIHVLADAMCLEGFRPRVIVADPSYAPMYWQRPPHHQNRRDADRSAEASRRAPRRRQVCVRPDDETLRARVERLRCFRGIDDLTALTIAAELEILDASRRRRVRRPLSDSWFHLFVGPRSPTPTRSI